MNQKSSKKKWLTTLKFFAAYLVAAWTFLQFVDWVLNRYNISPYWVDLLLWFFIGISPSLLIYFYHQERLNKRMVNLREKIFIPLNIIILFIALYFGFGNSDLGATTKDIAYKNDAGTIEKKTITKEEFRVGIPIYNFEQIKVDSTIAWLSHGIGRLLQEDLQQNKNISPYFEEITSTTTKIREASLFYKFYVDGTYEKVGSDYKITVYIRKATNAKILKEKTFQGPDVLSLLDDISVYITSNSGIVENNNLVYLDLPINEFMSNSLPALKAYVNRDFKTAYDIDQRFALAYLEDAKRNIKYNQGTLEARDVIDKAVRLKNELPLQKQLEVFIQRSLAYGNYEDAERQVKLQLEVDPSNSFYNNILFAIYSETRNVEAYLTASEALFNRNPSGEHGLILANAAMLNGEDKRVLDAINAYEIINPAVKPIKFEPLIFMGKSEEAKKEFINYKLSNPNNRNRCIAFDSIFQYFETHALDDANLKQFTGHYRSEYNEQSLDLWIHDDRLIQSVKNQSMRPFLPAGDDAIGGGFLQSVTFFKKLIKDDNGKIIGLRSAQYYWNATDDRFFWKLDPAILEANAAFREKNMDKAKALYETAIALNPKHAYLQNILDHIQYIQSNSAEVINSQNQNYVGNYGPRKFWIEDGKFYYKRKSDDSNLVKVELLPISENRYMDLTRLGTIMEFVEDASGKLASKAYSFIIGEDLKFEWEFVQSEEVKNYFIKDD